MQRGKRVLRTDDLRRADGAGRGRGGRRAQAETCRGDDQRRSPGGAVRRLSPAAGRVRARSRRAGRGTVYGEALDVEGAVARRFYQGDAGPVMRRLAFWSMLVAVACTEQATAPGDCPDFCPGGQIVLRDTIFTTIIERDSAFRGYLQAYQGTAMAAADVPGVQSRPYFVLNALAPTVRSTATDTTQVPIFADSARLRVTIVRKDTSAVNVRLQLHALPLTVDSLSSFADLGGPVIDSVNLSDLIARPFTSDTATRRIWGDSIRTDSAGHVLKVVSAADSSFELYFSLDTLQAPFS